MEFSPSNPFIKRCMQAMNMAEKGLPDDAMSLFLQTWNESSTDFEKYLSAYFMGRYEMKISTKLDWFLTAVSYAQKVQDPSTSSSFETLYFDISRCYADLHDHAKAREYADLSDTFKHFIFDAGPFYHGTKADLQVGDLLKPGGISNYQAELVMNHIYFTAMISGAGLAAELAKGNGTPRVFRVEPSGSFENDPNVTNKKFPGNPTRSYRSKDPLKVVAEITDWIRLSPQELQSWKDRSAGNSGKIIN